MEVVKNDPELATEMITLLGKELKNARQRIRELEGQIQNGDRGSRVVGVAETRSSVERRLKAEVDKLSEENTALRSLVEEIQRRVKEEAEEKSSIPPPEKHAHDEDLENKVKELEEALKVYHGKYKAQKVAKQTLKDSLSELETRVKELTSENSKLRQAAELSSKPSEVTLPGEPEFVAFMTKFPHFDGRPHYKRLHPICYRGVDLAGYLSGDSSLEKFSKNFLYFPGRLLWCRWDGQHGMAFGPRHIFDAKKGHWEIRSRFERQYGKRFELFYLSKQFIYYGGTYACHNLRSWSPEGSPMPTERVYPDALAEASLLNIDSVDNSKSSLQKAIEQLYIDQVLRVEVMGLQCVGFNTELYEILDRRFRTSQPVLGKREGSQLEGRELAKKNRTTS